MTDYVWDIETYPNCITIGAVSVETYELTVFEISDRMNQWAEFRTWFLGLRDRGDRLVGFNNNGFDYPVIHKALAYQTVTPEIIYGFAQAIIDTPWDDRFSNIIWDDQQYVQQIDLYKIHHFDNQARTCSLKVLECNMRSKDVRDLPFPPGTVLTPEQMDILIEYNLHDIRETWRFYLITLPMIEFREKLTAMHGKSFMNFNDTKIGKEFFIMELNKAGIATHTTKPRKVIQTRRKSINLGDAVLPHLSFEQPEFQRVTDYLRGQTITQTKGAFDGLEATVNGFTFVFGLGGIHGSVESRALHADADHRIIDIDVVSYYTSVAITNGFYPEHLGEDFCRIYQQLFEQRKSHAKGTPENAALKLALNGVYGDSNNTYSCFYDPLYTMRVTINGQLLLCKLAEQLMQIPGLEMIQINTDGLTVRVPRSEQDVVSMACHRWECDTGMTLESVDYSRMFIRDVNNYVAEYAEDGKLKRKSSYAYKPDFLYWSQNHSSQVIAKAAEAFLVRGESVRQYIETCTDLHDFLINTKVPRNSKLVLEDDEGNQELVQNTTRYYVSREGRYLYKYMPPLPKKPDDWRRIGIKVGHKVWVCNRVTEATGLIDYEYYIAEAEKLVAYAK